MKNRSNQPGGIFSVGALSFSWALLFLPEGSRLCVTKTSVSFWFFMKTFTVARGWKVTLNGVRIGRVERFFIGDAIEDGPVPVQVEINRKLVLRHMVEQKNEIFDEDGKFKKN